MVNHGNNAVSWNIYPTLELFLLIILPEYSLSKEDIIFNIVLLPHPLGPTSAKKSPWYNEKLMLSNTWI